MPSFDIFSKRQKKLRGEVPDVYVYDKIPLPLRVQIVQIWQDALSDATVYHDGFTGVFEAYKFLVEALCREYGVFNLSGGPAREHRDYATELANVSPWHTIGDSGGEKPG